MAWKGRLTLHWQGASHGCEGEISLRSQIHSQAVGRASGEVRREADKLRGIRERNHSSDMDNNLGYSCISCSNRKKKNKIKLTLLMCRWDQVCVTWHQKALQRRLSAVWCQPLETERKTQSHVWIWLIMRFLFRKKNPTHNLRLLTSSNIFLLFVNLYFPSLNLYIYIYYKI